MIILAALLPSLVAMQTLTTVLDLRDTQLTKADFQVNIYLGNSLEVLLTENPSTGHSWSVDELMLTRVTLVSTQYSPASPVIPGSGGSRSFVFKAKTLGVQNIPIVYKQPFETTIVDTKTVNVNVVELGIPQKVEVAKAALFSDYLSLLKVDIAAKAPGEYPLIEPISLLAIES